MNVRLPFTVYRLPFVLCIIAAILLILSFPNFNLSFLAYFAFVPLFFAVGDKKPSQAFLFGYVTGLIFFLGSMHWLIHVTLLGLILLSLYLALYFGLFTFFLRITNGERRTTILIVSAIWVVLEYLRATVLTGVGWSLLGYSQYKNLPIIQIADIAGAYGVSFLVVMVNVAIYQVVSDQVVKWSSGKVTRVLEHSTTRPLITTFLCLLIVLGYGYFKLIQNPEGDIDIVKISVIQGNIPQHQKWDTSYADFIFDRYEILTKVASADEPDLVIWPETAFPGYFEEDDKLTERMKNLASDVKIPILFGTPTYYILHTAYYHNSAILLDRDGKVVKQYNKLHLVPFGEYVPFGKYGDFLRDFIDKPIGDFKKGNEYTIFELEDGLRLGVLICFEDIFSNLVRNFVAERADFMINITNDAWFMRTGAPYQHAQASVFRAVENRVPVVRAANTGLSCFIDAEGRILSRVKNREGEDIFIEGFDTQILTIQASNSFYTKYGDIFAYMCIAMFLVALLKRPAT